MYEGTWLVVLHVFFCNLLDLFVSIYILQCHLPHAHAYSFRLAELALGELEDGVLALAEPELAVGVEESVALGVVLYARAVGCGEAILKSEVEDPVLRLPVVRRSRSGPLTSPWGRWMPFN
jgi:hypothetical protein